MQVKCWVCPCLSKLTKIVLSLTLFGSVTAIVDSHLERRQNTRTIFTPAPPTQCVSVCGFFTQTTTCTNNPCVCEVWAGAGATTVSTCATCISAISSDLANAYLTQESDCIAALKALNISVSGS